MFKNLLVRFGIVKILANYHCLLALSAFVWVWLYNGEFWHKVNTYIAQNTHNLTICDTCKTNKANKAKSNSEISTTLTTLATPATVATTEAKNTKSAKQALPKLDNAHQSSSSHSTSSALSSPPPPPKIHTLEQNKINQCNASSTSPAKDSSTQSFARFWIKSSIFLATFLLLWTMLEIIMFRAYAKSLLGVFFVVAGVCSYFLDSLHISFSASIIDSFLQTNPREASDFLSPSFALHFGIFVALPLVILCATHLSTKLHSETLTPKSHKPKILLSLLASIALLYALQGTRIVDVFREQRLLFVLNPFAPIRASIDLAIDRATTPSHYTHLGEDATTNAKSKLFVLVIGESARAANFPYSGYERDTTPHTAKVKNLVYFSDFTSCGVITAISVPCLLTHYPRKSYTHRNLSLYSDSALDIAKKAGYEVYWVSNNGGECIGGVCARLDKEKIIYFNQSGQLDADMLPTIKSIITKNTLAKSNTLLVIQLQGSHGARYDLRYPKEFEIFSPVCANNELSQCQKSHIQNAYDNSLIYTDFVLASIISLLNHTAQADIALWYMSDHGESLGEYGQYMHGGFPYSLAPQVQKQIPSFMWFKSNRALTQKLQSIKDKPYSHDFVFHTLLGLLEINTKDYDKDLDIFSD